MFKTIEGICKLYSVDFFIDYGKQIGIYNAPTDTFHLFQWMGNRYSFLDEVSTLPNWVEHKVGIGSCTNSVTFNGETQ